jgi:hypothetical protein
MCVNFQVKTMATLLNNCTVWTGTQKCRNLLCILVAKIIADERWSSSGGEQEHLRTVSCTER